MYALVGLLNPNGFVNAVLMWLGIIEGYQADRILSLYGHVADLFAFDDIAARHAGRLDQTLNEAWLTGANHLPSSQPSPCAILPGIIAGCLLVFIPAVGEFVIPALLGGPDQLMLGKVLWTEFSAS